jgi:hypothetical protein
LTLLQVHGVQAEAAGQTLVQVGLLRQERAAKETLAVLEVRKQPMRLMRVVVVAGQVPQE